MALSQIMFSIRIVNSDFYTAAPIPNLDACSSAFRETTTDKVPVIRIYGATPSGQKSCLHVHGVFPYIYVPYDGTQPTDKYLKQFAVSVDFAVQVSLGRASSSRQHVYEMAVVKGIPFYGYHEGEKEFLKISLYNPFLVTRVVSLLQNGAVMNKVFQPHEAHIPYLLQFFMDYNLYGMNLLHVSTAKFRKPVRLVNGETGAAVITQKSLSPQVSPKTFSGTPSQIWNEDTVPRDCLLGSDVERLSLCELEVDVLASDILNKLEIGVNIGTNPGLAAIWEDEQQRRRDANESSQISAPSSQDRGLIQDTETERRFKERIKEIIDERDLLIQSQIEKLGREALSPQELASFEDSICSLAASQREAICEESLDAEAVSQLLSQHVQGMLGDGSVGESSQVVIDEDEPVVNQSIVQEVVEASPSSFSQDLSSSMDKQMIDILASLADEPSQPGSQRAALSQSIVLDQGDAPCDEEVKDDESLSEDDESIMMSQRVWDDIEQHAVGSGDEQATDERDSHVASQRASHYDLEGMSDTWSGSFLGRDIPQLDGAADDPSDGQEDFSLPRRRLLRGQARKRSNQLESAASETLENSTQSAMSSPRPRSTQRTSTEMTSKAGAVEGKVEDSAGEDVWPLRTRAIRTYSKKGKSAPRTKVSPALNEDNVKEKDEDEAIEVVKNTKEEDNAFRLFLSESSDSEDGNSGGVNIGAEESEVIAIGDEVAKIQKTEISTEQKDDNAMKIGLGSERRETTSSPKNIKLEARKRINVKTPTVRNDHYRKANLSLGKRGVEASKENLGLEVPTSAKKRNCSVKKQQHTPEKGTQVITKYFPSPSKNPEGITTRRNTTKQLSSSSEQPSTAWKKGDEESTLRTVSPCSTEREIYSCENTLRKRNLSMLGEKDKKLSHVKTSGITKSNTDLAASLSAVSGAMSCLKVTLEDVSQISTLEPKFIAAQTRLKTRREASRQSFTRIVDQKLNSPVRKEMPGQKCSSLRSKKNETSTLSKKRTSPKSKEERTKKYGTLPVLIAKSPMKNSADSSHVSWASIGSQQSQVDAGAFTSQILNRGTEDTGTGYSSSRSRTRGNASSNRQTGLSASERNSGAYAFSNEGTTRKETGLFPSRLLPLQSASGNEGKSRSEASRTLSLSRRGLKRKLVMEAEKEVQLTPVGVFPGSIKKRKLSLKLKANSSRTFSGKERVDKNLVTPREGILDDRNKSVEVVNDTVTKPGLNIGNNGRRLVLDGGNDFASSRRGLLDDVTCVPSSPGEPDSSDESSLIMAKPSSPLVSTNNAPTCSKPEETSNASFSTESERETADNVANVLNYLQLLPDVQGFPKEKDTEILANALFNMSFPSPLPWGEECYSPPHPSTPLETKCVDFDVTDQQNSQDKNKGPTLCSSVVEEDDLSDVIETQRSSIASFQKQVQQTACFSPAGTRVPEGSSFLPFCPQLGETQSQIERIPIDTDDNFGQKIREKEITFDSGSLDSRKILTNRSNPKTNEKLLLSEETTTEGNGDFISYSEFSIYKNTSSGNKTSHDSAANESSADLSDRELVRAESRDKRSIDVTGLGEAVESSSPSTENREFVIRLSTEEESFTRVQSSVHSEIEISKEEGYDNPPQVVSTEAVCFGTAAVEPVIHKIDQASSTYVTQDRRNFTVSNLGTADIVAIKPLRQPPTSDELISSLKDYGLPQCKYQEPFCSNPDDIPACPREVGGRVLRIESKEVSSLAEFESLGSSQGLKHWRTVMASAQECGIRRICQAMDDVSSLHKNVELKIALMGDGEIVVTPCRGPPAPEAVKAWARDKLTKHNRKGQKQEENLAPKTLKQIGKSSEDKNVKGAVQDQDSEKQQVVGNVSKSSEAEWKENAIPSTSGSIVPSKEVTHERSIPSLDTTIEVQKGPDVADGERKSDVMELSDSSSPVEVTSPCSLFSPNETKIFTFASGTQRKVVPNRTGQGEILGTQPMRDECHDAVVEPKEVVVTSGTSCVTVTSFKLSPEQTPSTTKQPLTPLLQTQSPVLPAPYHSTPVATKLVFGAQSPRCTPISNAATKVQRLDTNVEVSVKKNTGAQALSDQAPSLRQQLLASQFKFVTPGAQPRRSMPWSSQIEGPSPNNTYGFKVTQMNLQNAKALHEVQHLTLFSLELHVRTRREARPDPEFDPICAIFYYIQTDTPLPCGKNKVTGVICVDPESVKISTSSTKNKEDSQSNSENPARKSPYKKAIASTSTSNVTISKTIQNTSASFARPLLCRTGITAYDVQYVTEEKDLFPALLDIIRKWDPDILIGYEVQMFSWGYLLERALTFEIDLCTRLSRIKGSSSSSNMDAEKDRWGAAHASEIKIAGRIILNVWRLMRHEVTLNSYSFENIAFHVLHERIPLFTFRTLSDWWDHRTSLNRWRTVDHYVTRCRGNVRILESVDFIGRTSELARLFGILFYSVISRGSQYRVESMMLRIAKPMNYIPVSPSVEQRGAMRAPETIPLVMEPESRFYSDPVLVLDFQSLYPSMIIAYNYCFSTCLGRVCSLSEYGEFKFGATSLCVPPSLLKRLEGNIHISPNGVAFVKPSVRKGILPSMLDEILQTRIMVKTSMKRWKADKSLGRMLDARQLGLKLIANVTFGYTSAHYSGRMPCVEIGDTIVRKARETLERAIDLVNNTPRWGARVVYGDTDSLFVLLKGVTKEQAFSIGKDIVDTVTAMNPKPVKLKFEKVYLPCVLQTKKRYVGYMYETLDQKEPVFDAKGIETVRRDSCPAVAKILEKSLRFLFETRDLSLVKKYVQRQCSKLMEGRASLQDFTFAKEYRGMKNYKPGACVPALELTRRMLREDRRSEPRVGERVPYVVVYGSPGLPLIQLVRRPYEVLQDPGLRLNASYYITKQILPPLNRVFALIGLDVFTWYAELPRVVRVAQMPTDAGNRKKGTISQYFSTMTCPVCQDLTPTDLCSKCRARPQVSAVTLMNRMRGWERTHQHLAEICYGCCGSRDSKLCCVSLDCPVFYKLVQCTRDVTSSQHLRTILENL